MGEGEHRPLVATGGSPESEVDPAREERLEHAEVLRDLECGVVGQHHAAAPDADAGGGRPDLADQDLRARARDPAEGVVLRDPEALVAHRLTGDRELDRLAQRVGAGAALPDGRLLDDAQHDGLPACGDRAHLSFPMYTIAHPPEILRAS